MPVYMFAHMLAQENGALLLAFLGGLLGGELLLFALVSMAGPLTD